MCGARAAASDGGDLGAMEAVQGGALRDVDRLHADVVQAENLGPLEPDHEPAEALLSSLEHDRKNFTDTISRVKIEPT